MWGLGSELGMSVVRQVRIVSIFSACTAILGEQDNPLNGRLPD